MIELARHFYGLVHRLVAPLADSLGDNRLTGRLTVAPAEVNHRFRADP